ncbi:Unknown protein, partial [Striga hermonthica]
AHLVEYKPARSSSWWVEMQEMMATIVVGSAIEEPESSLHVDQSLVQDGCGPGLLENVTAGAPGEFVPYVAPVPFGQRFMCFFNPFLKSRSGQRWRLCFLPKISH